MSSGLFSSSSPEHLIRSHPWIGFVITSAVPFASSSGVWASMISGTACLTLTHVVVVLFFIRPPPSSISHSFTRGFSLALSLRAVGTQYRCSNISDFPGVPTKNSGRASSTPSRSSFIVRNLLLCIWACFFLDATYQSSLAMPAGEKLAMYGSGPGLEWDPAPWRQSREQIVGRLSVVLFGWFVNARVMITLPYRAVSTIAVALGISDVADWPPLFGSYRDAYTLRGLWGKSWHQMLRLDFTTFSKFLTRDSLRMPYPSFLERYTNVLIVFGLSALLHVFADIANNIPPAETGAFFFFLSFPLGIMFEDGIQAFWRNVSGEEKSLSQSKEHPLWHKAVGYVWVATFYLAVCPTFMYNHARGPAENAWFVPYELTKGYDPEKALGVVSVVGVLLGIALEAQI